MGKMPSSPEPPDVRAGAANAVGKVVRRERLGGLLSFHYRIAA